MLNSSLSSNLNSINTRGHFVYMTSKKSVMNTEFMISMNYNTITSNYKLSVKKSNTHTEVHLTVIAFCSSSHLFRQQFTSMYHHICSCDQSSVSILCVCVQSQWNEILNNTCFLLRISVRHIFSRIMHSRIFNANSVNCLWWKHDN